MDAPRLLDEVIDALERRRADRSGLAARDDPGRDTAVLSQTDGAAARWCCPSSWRSDHTWRSFPPLSRRASEFTGVALFAGALIWLIALVSYEPSDPVWFFSAGDGRLRRELRRPRRRVPVRASFQVFGYASYVVPALLGVAGWNFFWCRQLDAAYTKAIGAGLLFTCLGALLALVVRQQRAERAHVPRRRLRRRVDRRRLCSAYLNRPGRHHRAPDAADARRHHGDAVLVRPRFAAGIQGGAACRAAVSASFRAWREERRRESRARAK